MKITVITADVISSRTAGMDPNTMVNSLASIKHTKLLVPFSPSRGDEIQGVMEGWLPAPQLVRILRWHCRPLKLRIGLGIGYHVGPLTKDSWQLSGPAFFKARQALDMLGKAKTPGTTLVTGCQALDTLANSSWLLLDTIVNKWTSGQWEAVMTYEKAGTLAAAGKILGVAPQNVQKRCKAAHWNQVRQAEQALGETQYLVATCNPKIGESQTINHNPVRREKE